MEEGIGAPGAGYVGEHVVVRALGRGRRRTSFCCYGFFLMFRNSSGDGCGCCGWCDACHEVAPFKRLRYMPISPPGVYAVQDTCANRAVVHGSWL